MRLILALATLLAAVTAQTDLNFAGQRWVYRAITSGTCESNDMRDVTRVGNCKDALDNFGDDKIKGSFEKGMRSKLRVGGCLYSQKSKGGFMVTEAPTKSVRKEASEEYMYFCIVGILPDACACNDRGTMKNNGEPYCLLEQTPCVAQNGILAQETWNYIYCEWEGEKTVDCPAPPPRCECDDRGRQVAETGDWCYVSEPVSERPCQTMFGYNAHDDWTMIKCEYQGVVNMPCGPAPTSALFYAAKASANAPDWFLYGFACFGVAFSLTKAYRYVTTTKDIVAVNLEEDL